jgi:hypothetical protein
MRVVSRRRCHLAPSLQRTSSLVEGTTASFRVQAESACWMFRISGLSRRGSCLQIADRRGQRWAVSLKSPLGRPTPAEDHRATIARHVNAEARWEVSAAADHRAEGPGSLRDGRTPAVRSAPLSGSGAERATQAPLRQTGDDACAHDPLAVDAHPDIPRIPASAAGPDHCARLERRLSTRWHERMRCPAEAEACGGMVEVPRSTSRLASQWRASLLCPVR